MTQEHLWDAVLALKAWVSQNSMQNCLYLAKENDEWIWTAKAPQKAWLKLRLGEEANADLDAEQIARRKNLFQFEWQLAPRHREYDFILDYIPYALLPWEAYKLKRTLAISHFAQSLDGKIATKTGDSKWIGSDENLVHAHRMRALCEGILIGSGTLKSDQPSLTVRHVVGKNPQRIVLGNPLHADFESLKNSCSDDVWLVGRKDGLGDEGIVHLNPSENAQSKNCEAVLKLLFKNGIHSVYIEGGSKTTSRFLLQGMIDILQLHLSPHIFGSGIPGFCLPEIQTVPESVNFESYAFQQIGRDVMFVGKPLV